MNFQRYGSSGEPVSGLDGRPLARGGAFLWLVPLVLAFAWGETLTNLHFFPWNIGFYRIHLGKPRHFRPFVTLLLPLEALIE